MGLLALQARHNIKNYAKARQKEAEGVSLAIFTTLAVRNMMYKLVDIFR